MSEAARAKAKELVRLHVPDPHAGERLGIRPLNEELMQALAEALDAFASEQADEHRRLLDACATVLEAFDAQIFVRNTDGDSSPGWAFKLVKPVAALAVLTEAIEKARHS